MLKRVIKIAGALAVPIVLFLIFAAIAPGFGNEQRHDCYQPKA